MTIALILVGCLLLGLAVLAVRDLTQKKHAVTRNFPVIGHLRYLFEELGHPLRQYFFSSDLEERPYNRANRFEEFHDARSLLEFIARVRTLTGKPIGLKLVVGSSVEIDALVVRFANAAMARISSPSTEKKGAPGRRLWLWRTMSVYR